MSFKEIKIKKNYSSDYDEILNDFYIPLLAESVEYKRLAGFFSSTSLAISARGILGLIKNGGVMKLITSPKISANDYEVILKSKINPLKFFEKKMIDDIDNVTDEFIRDHLFALGWMLANNKLEIKIALIKKIDSTIFNYEDVEQSGIFHIKVGIFTDKEGNNVSFSGSVNESATAWTENIEEFKVCRSWDESQKEWLDQDKIKFEDFWNNRSQKVITIDLPEAVKKKLIEISPSNLSKINLEKWGKNIKSSIKLFDYQNEAINNWVKNNMKGIFEMATGTGKTFTALGCVNHILENNDKVFTVIACPYKHLIQQWNHEIYKMQLEYDKLIISDSSNKNWRSDLTNSLIDQKLGRFGKIIVLTTHRTFASDSFINLIKKELDPKILTFLIADEVHGIGSSYQRRGLDEKFQYRLGLSATPRRFFDDLGTQILFDYFGPTVFEFTLEDALTKINPATDDFYLTQYRYYPIFITLSKEKLEDYIFQTKRIAFAYSKTKNQIDQQLLLTQLLNKRANIVKNADEKFSQLKLILNTFPQSQRWTIIYCTPQQINTIMKILTNYPFIVHRFTMDEKTIPSQNFGGISEREYILNKFATGEYQLLIAMKILDEGVDVPPARIAILMASSGNPREYIQRIGRVIRKHSGKTEATIYDLIVVPSNSVLPPELRRIEKIIFERQLDRCEYIAKLAINSTQALNDIYSFKSSSK